MMIGADLLRHTGQLFEAFGRINPLHMGSLDDNDGEPAQLIDRLFGSDPLSRWEKSRFLLIGGAGHDRVQLQNHSTKFFAYLLKR